MAQVKPNRKKVLLLEPNYSNKFPPIGLMKLSTYHKQLGYEVIFYKGDLKLFVIERIADKCIVALANLDNSIDWALRKDILIDFIRYRKKEFLQQLKLSDSEIEILLTAKVEEYRNYYWKGLWEKEPEFDRVMVTTLFTFYWNITIDTIRFAKKLVKKPSDLTVGGVLATLQAQEIAKAADIKASNIHKGILCIPGQLDKGDDKVIDNLPLDYSILDEIEYDYAMNNAFYGYTTRGCIRKCAFCAVPKLEPIYNPYIPLQERVSLVRETYGDQKDLLLMDNNILASDDLEKIINEIVGCGFGKNDKFTQPDLLELSIDNLQKGINDRAYIRKAQSLIMEFYEKLKGDESYQVYKIIFDKYHINKLLTTKKENLLAAYEEIKDIYQKHFHPTPRQRYVDFNQGVDARLFTEEKVQLLSKINVRPLRVAFDDMKTQPQYEKAIRMSATAGMRDFSNYLLYNFRDKPIDLYNRLKINVDLCEELGISIYSFPMKYHPIIKQAGDAIDYSHNRDYIGEHWNRKYIRAVQAILNSTKGKIGRGKSFFYKAFGHTEEEFFDLLEMPETFILYRYFFESLKEKYEHSTDNWRKCYNNCMQTLDETEKAKVIQAIHDNDFSETVKEQFTNSQSHQLIEFYTNYRNAIVKEGTDLYKLKQEYDKNPTIALKRKRIM
ncbi:radical SAM protein [Viscerimonas tarda]